MSNRRPRLLLAAILFSGLGVAAVPSAPPALAQDADVEQMRGQIERLQQDVYDLQNQVYAGGVPAAGGTPSSGSLASQEVRIQELDGQQRGLTGKIEELTFEVQRIAQRLDKLTADFEFRLQALEQGQGQTGGLVGLQPGLAPATAIGSQAGTLGDPDIIGAVGAGTAEPPPPAPAQSLGTLTQDQFQATQSGAAAPASTQSSSLSGGVVELPAGSPEEQYNFAFGLLRQGAYDDAEVALRAFVVQNPDDKLAGNALYWLGETYYVRGNYSDAAVTFADGYQRFPKSSKAPDNLLKLGMSLAQLGQTADACKSLRELAQQFPTAPPNVQERASRERQANGCP